jgi:coatomer protein complex subunit epsilon
MQYGVFFGSQLKLAHPEHVLVKRISSAEESFDRACEALA